MALIAVLWAYDGWADLVKMAGEVREPGRTLPRALLGGALTVVAIYLLVNLVCLRVLGLAGLAATPVPASAVMEALLGPLGGALIAAGIAVSTLGFLSQSMLTAPRVYFAMALDGVFFRRVAYVNPRSRAPVVAIALQGALALLIALTGSYEQILNYVVSVDFIFFGLTVRNLGVVLSLLVTTLLATYASQRTGVIAGMLIAAGLTVAAGIGGRAVTRRAA